jgi:hypothetical protein
MGSLTPEETFRNLAVVAALDGQIAAAEMNALDRARVRLGVPAVRATGIIQEACQGGAVAFKIPDTEAERQAFFEEVVRIVAADGFLAAAERRIVDALRERMGLNLAVTEKMLSGHIEQARAPASGPGPRRSKKIFSRGAIAALGAAALAALALAGGFFWFNSPYRRAARAVGGDEPLPEELLSELVREPAGALEEIRARVAAGEKPGPAQDQLVVRLLERNQARCVLDALKEPGRDYLDGVLAAAVGSSSCGFLPHVAEADPGYAAGWLERRSDAAVQALAFEPALEMWKKLPEEARKRLAPALLARCDRPEELASVAALASAEPQGFADWFARSGKEVSAMLAALPDDELLRALKRMGPGAGPAAGAALVRAVEKDRFDLALRLSKEFTDMTAAGVLACLDDLLSRQGEPREAARALLAAHHGNKEIVDAIFARMAGARTPPLGLLEMAGQVELGATAARIRRWKAEELVKYFSDAEIQALRGSRSGRNLMSWDTILIDRHAQARAVESFRKGALFQDLRPAIDAATREKGFVIAEMAATLEKDPSAAPRAILFVAQVAGKDEASPWIAERLKELDDARLHELLNLVTPSPWDPWLLSLILQKRIATSWMKSHWTQVLETAFKRPADFELQEILRRAGEAVDPEKVAARALPLCPEERLLEALSWARNRAPVQFEAFLTGRPAQWFESLPEDRLTALVELCAVSPGAHARAKAALDRIVLRRKIEAIRSNKNTGTLPEPEKRGGEVRPGVTRYRIDNDTGATLTIIFDGTESFEVEMPPGENHEVEMLSGTYGMYASVDRPNVNPFRADRMLQGDYHSSFYIRRSDGQDTPPAGCSGNHRLTRKVEGR